MHAKGGACRCARNKLALEARQDLRGGDFLSCAERIAGREEAPLATRNLFILAVH